MPDFSVVWLTTARLEKDALLAYMAERNVLATLGLNDQIDRQVNQLATFPFLGKKGRMPSTFELRISRTPYIAAYRLHGQTVQILHIFHERRNWPPDENGTGPR